METASPDAPLAFLDLETTGLSDYHQPWEFGLLLRRAPTSVDEPHLYAVRPDLSNADPAALRVNRFYERTNGRGARPSGVADLALPDARPEWSERLATARRLAVLLDGAVVVGCNVQYDLRVLGRWLRKSGECPTWHYRPVDVGAMAWGYVRGRVAELDDPPALLTGALGLPWSTSALAAVLDVPEQGPDATHTALGDARFARDLFDAVTGLC